VTFGDCVSNGSRGKFFLERKKSWIKIGIETFVGGSWARTPAGFEREGTESEDVGGKAGLQEGRLVSRPRRHRYSGSGEQGSYWSRMQ
jgi:hypothetical protein